MTSVKLLLRYPIAKISEPIFTRLVTDFDVHPNVLAANVDAVNGGWLMLGLEGPDDVIAKAKEWISSTGITVNEESLA